MKDDLGVIVEGMRRSWIGFETKMSKDYPGKDVIDRARQEGRIFRCCLCGAEIIGAAIACVRPGCPARTQYAEKYGGWNEQKT
jgi:hypothetical protein